MLALIFFAIIQTKYGKFSVLICSKSQRTLKSIYLPEQLHTLHALFKLSGFLYSH